MNSVLEADIERLEAEVRTSEDEKMAMDKNVYRSRIYRSLARKLAEEIAESDFVNVTEKRLKSENYFQGTKHTAAVTLLGGIDVISENEMEAAHNLVDDLIENTPHGKQTPVGVINAFKGLLAKVIRKRRVGDLKDELFSRSPPDKLETLGDWRRAAEQLFGPDSGAVRFLDSRIERQGRDEIVRAPDSQMLCLLAEKHES